MYYDAGLSINRSVASSLAWVFWGFAIEAALFTFVVIASVPWFTTRMNRYFKIDKLGQVKRIQMHERSYPFILWAVVVAASLVLGMMMAIVVVIVMVSPGFIEKSSVLGDAAGWIVASFPLMLLVILAISFASFLCISRQQWERSICKKINGADPKVDEGDVKFPGACSMFAEERGIDELADMLEWFPIDIGQNDIEVIRDSFVNRRWLNEVKNIIEKGDNSSCLVALRAEWEYEAKPNSKFITRRKREK